MKPHHQAAYEIAKIIVDLEPWQQASILTSLLLSVYQANGFSPNKVTEALTEISKAYEENFNER